MINKILPCLLLLGVMFIFNVDLFAAGPPGPPSGGGGPPSGCWPPSACIPLDGGMAFLVVAGIAYGAKKAYDIKKS